jgi:triosephosphate isomerase (TIM)
MNSQSRRRPLVAGNWKMNGTSNSLAELSAIASGISELGDGIDAVICLPATLIAAASSLLGGRALMIGAQDCSPEAEGAFTGDVSAVMLADCGARHVILGHSERRSGRGETNADVRRKVERLRDAGLSSIVCIGETEAQMVAGETEAVLRQQLEGSLPDDVDVASLAIAYEPVWAIGTGRVPSLERIADLHAFLREALIAKLGDRGAMPRILYGGSVKPENASDIGIIKDVGGCLVGGASLKAADFLSIASAFSNCAVPVAD